MDDAIPDIPSLALNYRNLVLWFGMQLVVSAGYTMLDVLAPNASAQIVSRLSAVAYLLIAIAITIHAYRTARSLGSTAALVWAIAMLVPCVNVIALLILSTKATRVCRQHGIRVGLFGPRIRG